MNRLLSEFDRLYRSEHDASLVDAQGRVRALVLEVVQPAGWDALSLAWQGVQAELELPAPAIAVSGVDGVQLWFSLQEPVALARGRAFLEQLRARFLADVPPARVRLWPDDATPVHHAAAVRRVRSRCCARISSILRLCARSDSSARDASSRAAASSGSADAFSSSCA